MQGVRAIKKFRRYPPFSLATHYLIANPFRSAYLALAIFLAFASYTLMIALGSPFGPAKLPKTPYAGGISVKAAYGSLRLSYAEEIARIPGIKSVHYDAFMTASCRSDVVAQINGRGAIGDTAIPLIAPLLSSVELREWRRDRRAIIVGNALAKRCQWHSGMLLTLQGGLGSHPTLKVHVVAIYHAGSKFPMMNQTALVHYQYLDGLNPPGDQGEVLAVDAQATDPEQAKRLAVTIDAYFANHSPPTESSVDTTSQSALAQFGNILKIIEFVMAAVFACALLVTVNVATHAAAERRVHFALLRVLGFSRTWITMLAAAELLYVAILGCGLGLALGLALLHWVVKPLLGSVFAGFFAVPVSALELAPAIAAGIVIVSVLIPAWEIFRLRAAQLSMP
jgi:ABC-type lipoprotein release transport system permease subunit